jgi:subtilisin family serine protease
LNPGGPTAIPGSYIVVFRESAGGTTDAARSRAVRDPAAAAQSRAAQNLVRRLGGEVTHEYTAALTGFSARLTPAALEALRRQPGVAYIQADEMGRLDVVQADPPDGLDRTSERFLPLDHRYTFNQTGLGVHVYVIDTGIRATHSDFGGRVTGGQSFVTDPTPGSDSGPLTDCQGHGTHVAGTIGGTVHGIAKEVSLHPVRVGLCTNSIPFAAYLDGVDWVTANAIGPSVANSSISFTANPTIDTAVGNAIAAGISFVVSASNTNVDACGRSPARLPAAITVGGIDPVNDTRSFDSNFGPCVDLFGPGENIVSAGIASDTATAVKRGTSMATPHVAGVAALFLQNHGAATPADVRNALHLAANTSSTIGWAGIVNPGAGSPNELLHWGSVGDDGLSDGDPHLTTVDGLHYDFQAAGEFVLLREPAGLEIQVRQSPVSTSFRPGPDGYHGLSTCVSVNTAIAARVAGHRVSFQPDPSGVPNPAGLQLRVDGAIRPLTAAGIGVGPGRVRLSDANGLQIDFPDGTILVATPGFWSSQGVWYLHVGVLNTRAYEGIIGRRPRGGWLPALPDGSSLGAMPATPPARYAGLYQRFGNAWRVNNRTSLFDYRPGSSTATFTVPDWPTQSGSCIVPPSPGLPAPRPPGRPAEPRLAQEACRGVEDRNVRANCVFDVTATGDPEFARVYQLAERVRASLLRDRQRDDRPNVTDQRPRPARAIDQQQPRPPRRR